MAKLFRSMSLRTRIVLLVMVLLIAGIWGLAVRVAAVLQSDLEKLLSDQLSGTVSVVADDMERDIRLRLDALRQVAALITPDLLADPAKLQRFVEQFSKQKAGSGMDFFVANKKGIIIADYPRDPRRLGGSVAANANIREAMSSGKIVIGSPLNGHLGRNRMTVPIVVPLRDATFAAAGVLVDPVILTDSNMFGQLERYRIGRTGFFVLMSPKDRLRIMVSNDEKLSLTPLPAPGVNPLLDRRLQDGFEGPGLTINSFGAEVLTVSRNMVTTGWILLAAVPTKEIFAPVVELKRQVYLAAFLMWLAIVLVLQFVLRREFARLERAGVAMQRMTGGEEALAAIPVGRQDEIGKLIGNFNQLATERSRLDAALRGEITERKQAQRALDHAMTRLRALSERLTKSQEEERRAIAFELHEQSAQELAALKIQLEMLQPHCGSKDAQERLRDALTIAKLMQQRVRSMALGLHPPQLHDFGLYSAVRAHCKQKAEAAGWALHLDAPDAQERADRNVELACFRVVEEALTNIARHAKASEVWVDLHPSGNELHLSVRDNGVGFDAAGIHDRADFGSLGLPAMEERIRQVGGRLEIKSSPGSGTEIHAAFPARPRIFREFEDSRATAGIKKPSLH